jgi:quercetin dioxygenase-like cupin family protein
MARETSPAEDVMIRTSGETSPRASGKGVYMRATRTAVVAAAIIVASGLVLHVTWAQQGGITRIDLQRADLSVPGREVVLTIVELEAGVTSSRHTHPGDEIVYVLEGAPLEYAVEGRPTVTLEPGEVLFIPAGTIHAARNVGSRKGAELATYIVEKGKPLLTEVGGGSPK